MTASQPNFLWHNAVHEAWADEKLVFLFLAYEPTYSRDTAVERVKDFLERHEICSFQIYEITAPYDLLVRAWVPRRMLRHELKQHIFDEDGDITMALTVEVAEIVHHWPWAKSQRAKIGEMRAPTKTVLDRELPMQELEVANELQRSNGSKPRGVTSPKLPKRYSDARILTRPSYRPGIRFLVLVKVIDPEQWQRLEHRIRTLLNKAKATIRNPSLYRLDDLHQFLIFGQVEQREGSFHAINARLVSHINDYAASGGARTYSVFFPTPGFLAFRDELRLPELEAQIPEVEVEKLLPRHEGQRLEVKGSAFTELNDWVRGETDEPTTSAKPATDGSNQAVNELMRAIASLLNSDGGHIIVGALERSKYGSFERFQDLPAVNHDDPHRCCGVEFDYGENGDWDEFARRLREVIEKRFEPIPSTRVVSIRHAQVGGRDLCVIDVTVPDGWFWVKYAGKGGGKGKGKKSSGLESKFFVRLEGSSRQLEGGKMEAYKRENPRKGF